MTILVTGATGKVGRQLVEQLAARGADVRAASPGGQVRLDWTEPATWGPALDDVDRVFLLVPGGDNADAAGTKLGPRVSEFLDVAQTRDVSRVVLMTGFGMDQAPPQVEQRAVELDLQASSLEWTILRPNWFFQNFTHGLFRAIADAHDGVLRLAAGDAGVSFIDTRDIAAVAAETLLGEHTGREYALTGPESLTFTDAVAICRDAGTPIDRYEAVSDGEFRAALGFGDLHPEFVDYLSGLFAIIAAGQAAHVTGDVARVTGDEPRRFAEYVQGIG